MNGRLITLVVYDRVRIRSHERWTPEHVVRAQQRRLEEVRRHAIERSPFYREFHRGLASAPLTELPVLTKRELMARFDDVVTDPAITLEGLGSYFASGSEEPHLGRYWAASTSGSSGLKAVIPSSLGEWSAIVASYARASDWSGGGLRVWKRSRMAVVSSTTPWHQSSRVAQSVRSPFVLSKRYDAQTPLPELVSALNRQQPHVLIGYASVLQLLAREQLEGRLQVAPRSINASSEVFTAKARALVKRAFGTESFEVYAATETGGIAAECARHEGMHLFEDLVLVEPVDDQYRPVPRGEVGSRTLVTVLGAHTLPLIRYELTDRVRLSTRTCSCGLPFALIDSVEGRSDDSLRLPGSNGTTVSVHPLVFERLLDERAPAGWQVASSDHGLIVRLLVDEVPPALDGELRAALRGLAVRADYPVRILAVTDIPVGAAGKRPRFVHLPGRDQRA